MTATTRSEYADAATVLVYGAATAIIVGIGIVSRAISIFRPDGIAWTIPVDEAPVQATLDSGTLPVDGIVQEVMVIAPDVNTVSIACIIAALVVTAISAVLVIGSVIFVARNFLVGKFFVRANVIALNTIGFTVSIAPLIVLGLEHMGQNGILAAIGLADAETIHPVQLWGILPILAIGIALGLVSRAFSRGIALQKEAEGLV